MGLNSKIIELLDNVDSNNLLFDKKTKEKKIIKEIDELDVSFNILIINLNYAIWDIFNNYIFDCVILETEKNLETMNSILEKNNYKYHEGIYFNRKFLS